MGGIFWNYSNISHNVQMFFKTCCQQEMVEAKEEIFNFYVDPGIVHEKQILNTNGIGLEKS